MPDSPRFTRLGAINCGLALLLFSTAASLAGAATLCVNPGGTGGCKSTIGAAVAAALPGDTIQVAEGVYKEQVTITETLALVALDETKPPTIDATGLSNGIFVNGMSTAPSPGVGKVLISGFHIHNANFEGILVANGNDITIVGNHVFDNDKALEVGTGNCPGIPDFETNEGDDCGEGIHLMGVRRSTVLHNEIDHNSGGILISDETGQTFFNLISGNHVHDNPWDCGITMASHGPSPTIPSKKISFGIFHNTIANNHSDHNGLGLPGAGAGVGIFAPFPGTASYENVVINNVINDNGLPGVTMHNHAAAPPGAPVPAANLSDNSIIGNTISGNAADTEDAATSGPTGINIFSQVPVNGTVISQNVFEDETVDIAFSAPNGRTYAHFNNFSAAAIGVENRGASGAVTATDNWWHCAAGPGGGGNCATSIGKSVESTPWLASPFVP